MDRNKTLLIAGIIGIGALSRLIPHPWNITATASIALLGGTLFTDKRLAFILPILGLFISDLVLNVFFYGAFANGIFYPTMSFVYGAFILTIILGTLIKKASYANLLMGSLGSTLLFYVITNFGSWLTMPQLYSRDFTGLTSAYIAGLPFLQNSLVGNLFYTVALFSLYKFAVYRMNLKTV